MKAAIIGATGYTGFELIKILLKHPKIQISSITSDTYAGTPYSALYPQLTEIFDKEIEPNDYEKVANNSDIVFLCLPHAASMEAANFFYQKGKMVIDLSADFRYSETTIYETTYKTKHKYPELCKEAAYGIPEIFKKDIQNSKLLGNPGCYPTSIIIPLFPLLKEGLINEEIIADSKSGVSGAGKKPTEKTHFCEVNDDFKPYGVLSHRHESEIDFILKKANANIDLVFTPHLLPITRGIESTIYTKSDKNIDILHQCLFDYYSNSPFVRIYKDGRIPAIKNVANTNYIDIALFKRGEKVVIISCIDNLVKGASGQAVQNMNIMLDFNETLGLL
ncbi:N-acetyl-gamma-glutamyl-phosphate reductase [Deferribacter autotrophicus]|uniref:N-acetyl-gamma-glutamyl-phosphate reductase n=1 Tax=Deferribacter autotrophicus TaxID=500465 RepID=A0A5A8F4K3_9BACT|nr:N-acetyl-gamma-glutamyl-phosphate reductase [Deferribacter autotrophicus]KAA0258966.1 N-acetyl-gamma-glutamyl-phosphate reductase [Deferribacter autotrophicus]